MTPCIQYDDEITLVTTTFDEYDTDTVDEESAIAAAIDFNTGFSHSANQNGIDTDAIVFVPGSNAFVKANFYRLEEMLVKISLFGTPDKMAWYKVVKVIVARDTQLCNDVEHLELLLKKTAPPNVS